MSDSPQPPPPDAELPADWQARAAQLERLAMSGRLAGGLAHNLRNLLGGVGAMIEWCQRQDPSPERVPPALAKASAYLAQADELIAATLCLAAGKAADPAAPVHLAPLLADVALLLGHAEGRPWRFATDLPGDLPALAVPRAVLLDMLLNLSLNALEAMRPTAADTLRFTASALPDGRVAVRVIDSGPGFPGGDSSAWFEGFRSTRPDGVGLGLWMVRQQVTALGGTVAAESTAGGGATLVLTLPAAEALGPSNPPSRLAAPRVEPPSSAPGLSPVATATAAEPPRVLLVEDDALLRLCISEHLAECGWAVQVCRDGDAAAALCAAPATALDLVVTDYVIPGLHGVALVAAIRAARPALPILLVSAWPESLALEDLQRAGITDYLAKPFRVQELEAAARRLVAGRAP